jgi:hypothetical protein
MRHHPEDDPSDGLISADVYEKELERDLIRAYSDGFWGQGSVKRASARRSIGLRDPIEFESDLQSEPPYSDVGPLAVVAPDRQGRSALHNACNAEVAVALLSRGANPKASCFGRLFPSGVYQSSFNPAGVWLNAEEYFQARRMAPNEIGEKESLCRNQFIRSSLLPWERTAEGEAKWGKRQAQALDG